MDAKVRPMFRCLIHWMLACALLLGGIGNAAAAVAMGTLPAAAPPLQTDAQAAPEATHGEHPAIGMTHSASAEGHPCGKDCCADTGSCQCPCLNLAAVAGAIRALPGGCPASQLRARVAIEARPAPGLREDIRPPIANA